MLNPPPGHEILASARALLLDDLLPGLLPALPPEQTRKLRMIADAMGVAERELHGSTEDAFSELRLLAELYDEPPPVTLAPGEVGGYLRCMNVRLVRDIRAGALDRRKAGRLRRVLLEQVLSRLRIASPKYLRASGYG